MTSGSLSRNPMKMQLSTKVPSSLGSIGIGLTGLRIAESSLPPSGNPMVRSGTPPSLETELPSQVKVGKPRSQRTIPGSFR